jgi:hypothetical protein
MDGINKDESSVSYVSEPGMLQFQQVVVVCGVAIPIRGVLLACSSFSFRCDDDDDVGDEKPCFRQLANISSGRYSRCIEHVREVHAWYERYV